MGMIIAPCSVKTLADIAHGHSADLVNRAADVVLKERRRLVLAVREAPFTDIHLENMLKLSRMGVVISPPMPAFYNRPKSILELVDHTVARWLDLFGIEVPAAKRWSGVMGTGAPTHPFHLSSPRRRQTGISSPPIDLSSPRRKPGPSANAPPATAKPANTPSTIPDKKRTRK